MKWKLKTIITQQCCIIARYLSYSSSRAAAPSKDGPEHGPPMPSNSKPRSSLLWSFLSECRGYEPRKAVLENVQNKPMPGSKGLRKSISCQLVWSGETKCVNISEDQTDTTQQNKVNNVVAKSPPATRIIQTRNERLLWKPAHLNRPPQGPHLENLHTGNFWPCYVSAHYHKQHNKQQQWRLFLKGKT